MSNVVERCPNCGVEHDLTHTGPCEVCGTPLRFWCRRHSKDTGWLTSAECANCAAETVRARRAPVPPATRRPRTRTAPTPPSPAPARRDAGAVLREEAAEWAPRVAIGGASLAMRLARAAFVIARSVLGGALIFGIGAAIWGYQLYGVNNGGNVAIHTVNRDLLSLIVLGVIAGGTLGLLVGFVRALRILLA